MAWFWRDTATRVSRVTNVAEPLRGALTAQRHQPKDTARDHGITTRGPARTAPRLANREAVEHWARPRLATLDHEELWVLALDGHHGLRAARRVASGGIHGLHVIVAGRRSVSVV